LKFAARRIGVKLAQEHMDEFTKTAFKDRLDGRALEKAARIYVTKIEERIVPATRQSHNKKLAEIFEAVTKNAKTVLSGISSAEGESNTAGCGYLGSKKNPNTIWNSDALTKAAQTPGTDEITKQNKEKIAEEKANFKESYLKILQEKLADKNLIPNAKVHSVVTEPKAAFNSKLPENAMGIFGDHKEFKNIPKETVGETIKTASTERSNKKTQENSEVQIKASKAAESENWLFK